MLWTIAFTANFTAAQTDKDTALLADPTVTVDSNNHPLLPLELYGMWHYGMGNTLSRVRVSTPKFKPIARPLIRPIEQAANPSSRPIFEESFRHPRKYRAVEPISVLLSNAAPTGGEQDYVVMTLGDNLRTVPQGDLYTLRLTPPAFTPVANTYSLANPMAFDDTLEVGQYSIIGFEIWGSGGVFSRLIFPGPPLAGMTAQVRPGVIMPTAQGSEHIRFFRYGYLGEYGRFNSYAQPAVEEVATGTTAFTECYWDLVMLNPQIPGITANTA